MVEKKSKICSSCNASFTCYSEGCWCNEFPAIVPLEASKGCLCRVCLKLHIREEIASYLEELTTEKAERIQALGKPERLIQGIDYSINDRGSWVFSPWYLLRQGGCCGNECMNCPYPKELKK